jgi:hypothetical protein
MYYSKIKIDRNKKVIFTTRVVELPDRNLTLKDITKHVSEGETFTIEVKESESYFHEALKCLLIHGTRLETDKELKVRVKREETYMKNYEEYHASKKVHDS